MIFFKWTIFFQWIRQYFDENRQNLCLTVEIWAFLVADTFINERFFCTKLLFRRQSAKFATNCQIMNFSWGWYLYKCAIFCTNTPLFWPISAKLETNCQNINISQGIFFKWSYFIHKDANILLKIGEIRYFLP